MAIPPGLQFDSPVRMFRALYAYVAWFLRRHATSSFVGLKGLSQFQINIAPAFIFTCYLMDLYFLLQLFLSISFPRSFFYVYLFFVIYFIIISTSRLSRDREMANFIAMFERITPRVRRLIDVAVVLGLVLAIPLSLMCAVLYRDKFIH